MCMYSKLNDLWSLCYLILVMISNLSQLYSNISDSMPLEQIQSDMVTETLIGFLKITLIFKSQNDWLS